LIDRSQAAPNPAARSEASRIASFELPVGAAVSAGCLRAGESDVRYLMATLPLGTQVVVHA